LNAEIKLHPSPPWNYRNHSAAGADGARVRFGVLPLRFA
jgi:hypothetical protein